MTARADAGAGEAEGDAAPEAQHRPPRGPGDVGRPVALAAIGPGDEAARDPRKFLPPCQQNALARRDGVDMVGERFDEGGAVKAVEGGAVGRCRVGERFARDGEVEAVEQRAVGVGRDGPVGGGIEDAGEKGGVKVERDRGARSVAAS